MAYKLNSGDQVLVYGYDCYGNHWEGIYGLLVIYLDDTRVQVKMAGGKVTVVDRRQIRHAKMPELTLN